MPGFYIDRYDVSSAQYAAFLQDISHRISREKASAPLAGPDEYVHFAYYEVWDPDAPQTRNRVALAFDAAEAIAYEEGPLPRTPGTGTGWNAEELPAQLRGGVVWNEEAGQWQARPGQGNYPMIFVTWHGAQAYAEWVGAELPSEIEWEKAARGPAPDERLYPWESWDANTGNTASRWYERTLSDPINVAEARARVSDNPLRLLPVHDSHGDISPFGVYHLGGNVRSWCGHGYHRDLYSELEENGYDVSLLDTDGSDSFAIRGACVDDAQSTARLTTRHFERKNHASWRLGFRCAIRLND